MDDISVVVPFYNDAEKLRRCLDALLRQSIGRGKFKIFVVDNSPSGRIEDFPVVDSEIIWIHEPKRGSYSARNAAIKNIDKGIIAFTDADCVPDQGWLESAYTSIGGSDNAIIGGRIELITDSDRPLNTYEVLEEAFFGMTDHKRLIEKQGFAVTANLITRRSVFTRIGLFNDRLMSSGDKDWVTRAVAGGVRLTYADSAIVFHPRRSTFSAIVGKALRIVGGQINLMQHRKASMLEIARVIYRQSPLNPKMHAFAFGYPKAPRGWGRLHFAAIVEILSVICLLERIRVLGGCKSRRR